VTHFRGIPSCWISSTSLRICGPPPTPYWERPNPHRTMGVRAYLEPLLRGETAAVIAALEEEANDPTYTATQRQVVQRTLGSYRRNRPYMPYDEYLARGWPMGMGVVEGACGHLVNDRLEPSGMRWTKTGAQAVLDLRTVRLNGQWEVYGQFPRQQPHHRPYGTFAPVPELTKAQALKRVASSHLSTGFGHTQMIPSSLSPANLLNCWSKSCAWGDTATGIGLATNAIAASGVAALIVLMC
jgi:hypothetical protein